MTLLLPLEVTDALVHKRVNINKCSGTCKKKKSEVLVKLKKDLRYIESNY